MVSVQVRGVLVVRYVPNLVLSLGVEGFALCGLCEGRPWDGGTIEGTQR